MVETASTRTGSPADVCIQRFTICWRAEVLAGGIPEVFTAYRERDPEWIDLFECMDLKGAGPLLGSGLGSSAWKMAQ